jgi:hypothetical protein
LKKTGDVKCGLRIGERYYHHETGHRRMVSLDLSQDCERSKSIKVDIPHEETTRLFSKTMSTPRRKKTSRSSITSSDYYYWEGMDETDGSTFAYVQSNEETVAGSMVDVTTGNIFQFLSVMNGTMVVNITHVSDFPPEGEPILENLQNRKLPTVDSVPPRPTTKTMIIPALHQQLEQTSDQEASRKLLDDLGGNLDVLVVWSVKAECARSSLSVDPLCSVDATTEQTMKDHVALAISETNSGFAASGINTVLHLAHSYRDATFSEASSDAFSNALDDVRTGNIAGVHEARTQYGADIVVLIIDDSQYCGLATSVGYPRIDIMFSVTSQNCATGYYSFGHEIAHNMGCNHDRGQRLADLGSSGECSSLSGYNYGFRDPAGDFRTVLGYNCDINLCSGESSNSCTRINRYSNPTGTYNGKALGDAANDNVSLLYKCICNTNDINVNHYL